MTGYFILPTTTETCVMLLYISKTCQTNNQSIQTNNRDVHLFSFTPRSCHYYRMPQMQTHQYLSIYDDHRMLNHRYRMQIRRYLSAYDDHQMLRHHHCRMQNQQCLLADDDDHPMLNHRYRMQTQQYLLAYDDDHLMLRHRHYRMQNQQYLSIDVEGLGIHGLSVTEGTNDMSIIEQLSKIMHKICTQTSAHNTLSHLR